MRGKQWHAQGASTCQSASISQASVNTALLTKQPYITHRFSDETSLLPFCFPSAGEAKSAMNGPIHRLAACRWVWRLRTQMQKMAGRPNALGQQTRYCRPSPASWGSRYTKWFCPGICSTNNMPPFIFGLPPSKAAGDVISPFACLMGKQSNNQADQEPSAHRWNNDKTNSRNTKVSSEMLKTWKFHLYVGCCQQLEDWHLNWV